MIKVLVAEDERPISRSIVKIIKDASAEFAVEYIAYNGKQAKEYLDSAQIDIAFLDINMPIYDGLWLLEYINQQKLSAIPVILTGYQEFNYAQRAIKGRAFDYLLKPVADDELRMVLRRLQAEFECRQKEFLRQHNNGTPYAVLKHNEKLKEQCFIACCLIGGYSKGFLQEETLSKQPVTENYLRNWLEAEFQKENFWLAPGHNECEWILFISDTITNCQMILEQGFVQWNQELLPITLFVCTDLVSVMNIPQVYKNLVEGAQKAMFFDQAILAFQSTLKPEETSDIQKDELLNVLAKIQSSSTVSDLSYIFDAIINITGKQKKRLEYGMKCFLFVFVKKYLPRLTIWTWRKN